MAPTPNYTIFTTRKRPCYNDLAAIEQSIRNKSLLMYDVAADLKLIKDQEMYKPQYATFNDYAVKYGWDEVMVEAMIKVHDLHVLLKDNGIPTKYIPIGYDLAGPYLDLDEQQQLELARLTVDVLKGGELTIEIIKECKQKLRLQ